MLHGTEMVVLDPRWSATAAKAGLSDYGSILGYAGPLLSGRSTTQVYRLDPDPAAWPGGVYLKKFRSPSWPRFFLRTAKPYLEVRNYDFLRRLGLNVPTVLAVGQRRRFGGIQDAFILTAGIENARSLEEYFHDERLAPNETEMTEILDQLAETVRVMHRARFFHIDLQWRNILIQRDKGQIRVFLIDCPRGGVRRFLPRSWNGRMHDLAGLEKLAGVHLPAKERLKWFKQYAGITKIGWQDRFLIRRIIWEIESRRQI